MELLQRLRKQKESLKFVSIKRFEPSSVYNNGFIIDVSESLVMIQQFHDFYFDGFSIIRLADIRSVRCGRYEQFFKGILVKEGLSMAPPPHVPIESMGDTLSYFLSNQATIIVESEYDDSDEFHLCKILNIDGVEIQFKQMDALGIWEQERGRMPIDRISRIELNSPYISIFEKYSRER